MKLLFDHNLSPRLVDRLADQYPESSHVFLLGLDREFDHAVLADDPTLGVLELL